MTSNFYYVASNPNAVRNYDAFLEHCISLANQPEGRRALRFKDGDVNAPVFVFQDRDEYGLSVITLLPRHVRRDGFSSISYHYFIHTRRDVIDYLRRVIVNERKHYSNTGDPRAILGVNYEREFREVATALGLKPEKIGDSI